MEKAVASHLLILLSLVSLFPSSVRSCSRTKGGIFEVDLERVNEFVVQPKARIVYFYRPEAPSLKSSFLAELEWAAKHLHSQTDLGILVAKVNCRGYTTGFCDENIIRGNIIAFRGEQKVSLSASSLSDRHAIVASILHLSLVERVPIVRSSLERHRLQDACGNDGFNLLFLYVTHLGTYEHRVFMELAHGLYKETGQPPRNRKEETRWICAVSARPEATAELPKPSSWDEEEGSDSLLWSIQCPSRREETEALNSSNLCKVHLHWGALDLLQVAAFVEAFSRPAWSRAIPSGDRHVTDFDDLGLPMAYVLYGEKDEASQDCARRISNWFRGSLGVAVIPHTEVSAVQRQRWSLTTASPTVVLVDQTDGEAIVFNGFHIGFDLIREILDGRRRSRISIDENSRERPQEDPIPQLVQDDPLALAWKDVQPLKGDRLVHSLTDITFNRHLSRHDISQILFYLPWDTTSLLVERLLQFIVRNTTLDTRSFAKVDCFEWTDVCQKQNIVQFPSLLVYSKLRKLTMFQDLWTSDALQEFLLLTSLKSPITLSTWEKAQEFLNAQGPYQTLNQSTFYLAALQTEDSEKLKAYENASKEFIGRHLFALATGHLAQEIATRLHQKEPMLVAVRQADLFRQHTFMKNLQEDFSTQAVKAFVEQTHSQTFPELNERSFHILWDKSNPLALFVKGKDKTMSPKMSELFRSLSENPSLPLTFCWIESDSPTGTLVLSSFGKGLISPLFLIINKMQIYLFSGDWEEKQIMDWAKNVTVGQVESSFNKSLNEWKPMQTDFDFLSKIDAEKEAEGGYSLDGLDHIRPHSDYSPKKVEPTDYFGPGGLSHLEL